MKTILLYMLTIIGGISLAIRLYLKITTSGLSFLESIVQFFSYFTILTNLLVTAYCTLHILGKNRKMPTTLFFRPGTLTALTVYILLVGTVYHIALKHLWNPQGLEMILSEIHHTFVPLGTLILWIVSTEKELYNLKNLFSWILYPILYLTFVFIRGGISEFYPYPFIHVTEIGIGKAMINSITLLSVVSILFLVFHFIEIKIIRKIAANNKYKTLDN